MILKEMEIENFRLFPNLKINFSDGINIISGLNGQGKTSILEAIHCLSLLTSAVANHDRQMINLVEMDKELPVGRLKAIIEKGGREHQLEIRLIINGNENGSRRLRKEVIIDGSKKRIFDGVGFFNSVIFLPQKGNRYY